MTMAAGNRQTQGAAVYVGIPADAHAGRIRARPIRYPMSLRTGDIIQMTVTGGAGMAALTMQLRVQRVHEHVRRGRARV